MLRLYIDEVPNYKEENIINDVEAEFTKIKLTGTELEKLFIEKIDQGKYNDKQSFIDRFGFKISNLHLSTGCKAALCLLHFPDRIINLHECGLNARDMIINYCTLGRALIEENGAYISAYNEKTDVAIDKYRFSNISRLNRYIFSERPFDPDFGYEGIDII